jgi:hypothetical protein
MPPEPDRLRVRAAVQPTTPPSPHASRCDGLPPARSSSPLLREVTLSVRADWRRSASGRFASRSSPRCSSAWGSRRTAEKRYALYHIRQRGTERHGADGGDADAVHGMWCVLAGSHPAPAPVLQPDSWPPRVRRPVPKRGFEQRPCDEYTPSTRVPQHLLAVLP